MGEAKKLTRAERNAQRRRSILRKAAAGFERAGYQATQIADVARAAKVAHGTVYRHFENKDDLFRAVVKRAVDEVLAASAGEELPALTRAALGALDGRARTLGLEARVHAPDEVRRLEEGLERASARFLVEPRRRALWRAAVLEAARQGAEPGWVATIGGLFTSSPVSEAVEASVARASGWR